MQQLSRVLVSSVASVLLAAVVALTPTPGAAAATAVRYVSPTGDDAADGASAATAWRTLGRVQQALDDGALGPGSEVRFARGATFRGSLTFRGGATGAPTAPLVLTAYGTGARPVLSASWPLTGWSPAGTNRWRSVCGAACPVRPAQLSWFGGPLPLARWPNADGPAGGYRTITGATGRTSITDAGVVAASPSASWVGGEVVVRSIAWILDRSPITAQSGGQLTLGRPTSYDLEPGWGWFVQDHPAALDLPGEWVYDPVARAVTIVALGDPSAQALEISRREHVVDVGRATDIVLRGLELAGAARANLAGDGCRRVTVSDVVSRTSGGAGIELLDCDGSTITSTLVQHAADIGIDLADCGGCTVRSSRVLDIALLAGMGQGGDGHYVGVRVGGPSGRFEGNVVERIGYLGVDVRGSAVVRRNVVRAYNQVKTDGAGIYTYENADVVIQENLVGDSAGSLAGTPWTSTGTHGIYVDDDSQRVTVRRNTVVDVGGSGIYLHNTADVIAVGNTIVGPGEAGVSVTDDDLGAFTGTATTLRSNTVVLDRPGVPALEVASTSTPPNTGFLGALGSFGANRYCGVFADAVIDLTVPGEDGRLSLAAWQALSGQDTTSATCTFRSPSFRVTATSGRELVVNGTFDAGIDGWFGWPDALEATWDPVALDAGALRVGNDGSAPFVHIDTGIGAVAAGQVHRLRLTVEGATADRTVTAYLRMSGPPYEDLSERVSVPVGTTATEHEVFLTAARAHGDSLLIVEQALSSAPTWLDDVGLRRVSGTPVRADDIIQVLTNPTAAAVVRPVGPVALVDPAGTVYPAGSSVTVPAWGSVVLLGP